LSFDEIEDANVLNRKRAAFVRLAMFRIMLGRIAATASS
jgi:hypothetical protein